MTFQQLQTMLLEQFGMSVHLCPQNCTKRIQILLQDSRKTINSTVVVRIRAHFLQFVSNCLHEVYYDLPFNSIVIPTTFLLTLWWDRGTGKTGALPRFASFTHVCISRIFPVFVEYFHTTEKYFHIMEYSSKVWRHHFANFSIQTFEPHHAIHTAAVRTYSKLQIVSQWR